jgi:hypothetical protein
LGAIEQILQDMVGREFARLKLEALNRVGKSQIGKCWGGMVEGGS